MAANIDINKMLFGDPPTIDELVNLLDEVYESDNISQALRLRIKRLLDRQQESDSIYKKLTRS